VIEGHKLNDEPLTKDEAKQALAMDEPPKKPPLSIWKIQNVVARHYGVTLNDIISQRRTAAVCGHAKSPCTSPKWTRRARCRRSGAASAAATTPRCCMRSGRWTR